MPNCTYTGTSPATYSMYLDATDPDHVTTLVAEPGKTYDVRPAEGYTVLDDKGERVPLPLPVPPDDHWTAEAKPAASKKKEQADA